jgi:hypothetical protein
MSLVALGLFVVCLAPCGILLGLFNRGANHGQSKPADPAPKVPVEAAKSKAADPDRSPPHVVGPAPPAPASGPELGPPPREAGPLSLADRRAAYAELCGIPSRAEAEAEKVLGRRPAKDNEKLQFRLDFARQVEQQAKAMREVLARRLKIPTTGLDAIKAEGNRDGWPEN